MCAERKGSLLNSLEGRHPFPRNRPPYPVTHGFEDLPTAVNNVETLVAVPQIIRKGAGLVPKSWIERPVGAPKSSVCRAISRIPAITKSRSACR